jgi:hypothetical protein
LFGSVFRWGAFRFRKGLGFFDRHASRVDALHFGIALCLTAFVVLLHILVLLKAGPLWRDEANSVRFALMPVSEAFSALRYDSFPIGTTAVFHLWTLISSTDQGFRVAGFLVGLATIAALWWNARTLRLGLPLVSLLLFAANPVAVRYGDSIRPYGLGLLFALIMFGFFARLITTVSARNIVGAAVSAVLCVQCTYQNAVMVLALCLAGLLVAFRKRSYATGGWIIAAGALAALSLVPYLGTIVAAREWAIVTRSPTTLEHLWSVMSLALGAQAKFMVPVWGGLSVAAILSAIAFTPTSSAASAETENQRDLLIFSMSSFVAVIAGFLILIRVLNLQSQPWYYLPVMAPCAVCLEVLLAPALRNRSVKSAFEFLMILVIIWVAPGVWSDVQVRATNVDLVAARIAGEAARDDLIVVSPWSMGISFHRAYHGQTPWMGLPPLEDLTIHRYDLLKATMAMDDPMQPLLQAVSKTLSSGNRLWVVGYIAAPPKGQAPPSIARAPYSPAGWDNDPYVAIWTLQLGSFITSHASSAYLVPIPAPYPVSPLENLRVFVVSGWRP